MKVEGTVVGLPRSRTFWFSQLLTYGTYFCYHDYYSYKYPEPPDGKFIYNSTPNPYTPMDGKVVIIERDWFEAEDAFYRFIGRVAPIGYRGLFEDWLLLLKKKQGLHVSYEDIDERIDEILAYLEIDLPRAWIDYLTTKNLQSTDDGTQPPEYPYINDFGLPPELS